MIYYKNRILFVIYFSNYKFPPPTTAVDDTLVEEIGNKEIQVSENLTPAAEITNSLEYLRNREQHDAGNYINKLN